MESFSYDLHVHSCLSPCADDDMTPANIAGLASLLGLRIVALTDHNSTKNCPAFFAAAKRYGIVPVAGMELTTAEDIHIICLFESLPDAMAFGEAVDKCRIKIENRAEVFGNQFIMNAEDEVIGEEQHLLINATALDIESAYELCREHGGICYPAHIDRDSGGMVAMLGTIPDEPPYTAFELNFKERYGEYVARFPSLKEKRYVVSSDAHRLDSLSDGANIIELDMPAEIAGSYSLEVRRRLIEYLRGR